MDGRQADRAREPTHPGLFEKAERLGANQPIVAPAPGHGERDYPAAHRHPAPRPNGKRIPWAALLQRVFEIDALQCPRCKSRMRIIAAIEDPDIARRILESLKLPVRAPPLEDAVPAPRGPDSFDDEGFFDQSPAVDDA